MRVTFVIPSDSMTGGVRVVAIYADRLIRRGHEVVIISGARKQGSFQEKLKSLVLGRGWPKDPEPQPSYFTQFGIPVRTLEKPRPVVDSDVPESDVVIATWWETAEWVSDLSVNKGAKIYFIQHHEVFPYLPVERCHATYRLPLQKIVISHWLEKIMKEQYNDDKAFLIPNSVDTLQFFAPKRQKHADPAVGFVYSTTEFKGSDIVLAALELIKQRIPKLRVIAFGADRPSTKLPLPSWIEFHFRPPQDQIRLLYSKCDVWLCGSRSEGFYLPMLEAMACRCPVVSTRVGGPIDTVMDAVNGFLVEIEDASGLAASTLKVLQLSDADWQLMSDAALLTATHYSWDDAADRLENTLLCLANQHLENSPAGALRN